jgi:hypothetical protein
MLAVAQLASADGQIAAYLRLWMNIPTNVSDVGRPTQRGFFAKRSTVICRDACGAASDFDVRYVN